MSLRARSFAALVISLVLSLGLVVTSSSPAEAAPGCGRSVSATRCAARLSQGSHPALQYNSRGAAVRRLQRSLTAAGYSVPATGWYGPLTRAAVKRYQKSRALRVTGTVRSNTWRALQAGKAAVKRPAAKKKSSASTASGKAAKAVRYAYSKIGDPYSYGAAGPNRFDCSGLTMASWRAAGKTIPRTSYAQLRGLNRVSVKKLKPGDIVVYYSGGHVGLYVGSGKIIHSSRPGRPVSKVALRSMPVLAAVRP